jgi:hypothetical protein
MRGASYALSTFPVNAGFVDRMIQPTFLSKV